MREPGGRGAEFFRVGEQLGIPWFRLYLADSLANRFPPDIRDETLPRWFLLHLAVQAGSGHLRTDLESVEPEMREWYFGALPDGGNPDRGNPPPGFDAALPERAADEASSLVSAGLESGLIGRLDGEDSGAAGLEPPRPPLVITHDGRFIYFLRRRKEEDALLAALEARSGISHGGIPVPAVIPEQSERSTLGYFRASEGTNGFIPRGSAAERSRLSDSGSRALPWGMIPFIPDTPAGSLLGKLTEGRRLVLLAGGPGTGKTTTVAELLKLLAPGRLEVILAAPTGRAAARMTDSLEFSGRTIHSLLGIFPGRSPRHDANNPLAANLIIVDEASMVDLPLMNALLDALPDEASLLLVGDPDQLPSVEAGALLGDLLHGEAEAAEEDRVSPLTGSVVRLTRVYRSGGAILEAAAAVRNGDFAALKQHLLSSGSVRLHVPGTPDSMARIIADEYRSEISLDAAEVFGRLSTHAVLTPLRRGPWGVPAMNDRISLILGGTSSPFSGMPVMITGNDPSRKLWNGDRGVVLARDGRLRVFFSGTEDFRDFPLAALSGWEPAWIQTIHKSQGSEFDRVTILLPEGAERLLSREILYTAITRARNTVDLYADEETVEAALARKVIRNSRIRNWAAGGVRREREDSR